MMRHPKNKNKFKKPGPPKLKNIIFGVLIVVLFVIIFKFVFLPQKAVVHRKLTASEQEIIEREKILSKIDETLLKYGIRDEWITQTVEKRLIRVPGSVPIIQLCQEIANIAGEHQAEIRESYEDLRTESIILGLGFQDKLLINLKFTRDKSLTPLVGKIALIIDDFGYSLSGTAEAFLKLNIPLTVAIIPGLSQSVQIAEQALLFGKEILIHLPMEPLEEAVEDHGFTILVSQNEDEIRNRIKQACQLIPTAIGVNNHQGSKAIANERVVRAVLQELKEQNLFFIDSKTTARSLGYQLAKEMKLPAASRDVFLDDDENPAQIKKQLYKLARKARARGFAIGIGHVKPNTLAVLHAEIHELKLLGYQFVTVSSGINRPD